MKAKVAPNAPENDFTEEQMISDEEIQAILEDEECSFMGDNERYIPLEEAIKNRTDAAAILEYQTRKGRINR